MTAKKTAEPTVHKDIFGRVIEEGSYVAFPASNTLYIGTVGNDRKINDVDGPEVTTHLDLPMQVDNKITVFIIVKHKDIKSKLNTL